MEKLRIDEFVDNKLLNGLWFFNDHNACYSTQCRWIKEVLKDSVASVKDIILTSKEEQPQYMQQ